MKYSTAFERDWDFYTRNLDFFSFSGKPAPEIVVSSEGGPDAKECFYIYDSTGLLKPCVCPELLQRVLVCKASVNLHIKFWAYGMASGLLLLAELYKYLSELRAPQWVADAVVAQAGKLARVNLVIGENAKCL